MARPHTKEVRGPRIKRVSSVGEPSRATGCIPGHLPDGRAPQLGLAAGSGLKRDPFSGQNGRALRAQRRWAGLWGGVFSSPPPPSYTRAAIPRARGSRARAWDQNSTGHPTPREPRDSYAGTQPLRPRVTIQPIPATPRSSGGSGRRPPAEMLRPRASYGSGPPKILSATSGGCLAWVAHCA
jgi:hypothetical protein